jgi:signal peptidase I
MIKRVIALEGDKIRFRDGQVLVNETLISEPFVRHGIGSGQHSSWGPLAMHVHPVEVPKGHYFVMGDNREQSVDSRIFGFVDSADIVGRVVGIWRHGSRGSCKLPPQTQTS